MSFWDQRRRRVTLAQLRLELLEGIRELKEMIMAGVQEFRDKLAQLQTDITAIEASSAATSSSLQAIAADIQAIKDSVGNPGDGGLDAAETDEVRALVGALSDKVAPVAAAAAQVAQAAADLDASNP